MTPQEEKVEQFLGLFGSVDEFVSWCEGQGVKGEVGVSTRCLVAQAVETATGVPVAVRTVLPEGPISGAWRHCVQGAEYRELPRPLMALPYYFDLGVFPDLTNPRRARQRPKEYKGPPACPSMFPPHAATSG